MSIRYKEYSASYANGYMALGVIILSIVLLAYMLITSTTSLGTIVISVIAIVVLLMLATGIFILNPNEGGIVTLFGEYKGTVREAGMHWINPLSSVEKISLKTINFITETIKVNDERGNPIEVAATISYHVEDTSQAIFSVENYQSFTKNAVEAVLRDVVSRYPYELNDSAENFENTTEDKITLRGHISEVANELLKSLKDRLEKAGSGICATEAKINHLAYAPEIASTMLRRQQAESMIAARKKVVFGAVEIVESALKSLDSKGIIKSNEMLPAQKVDLISNLLVVLVSDKDASPVINTSSTSAKK